VTAGRTFISSWISGDLTQSRRRGRDVELAARFGKSLKLGRPAIVPLDIFCIVLPQKFSQPGFF
jgi:hypothetical protein